MGGFGAGRTVYVFKVRLEKNIFKATLFAVLLVVSVSVRHSPCHLDPVSHSDVTGAAEMWTTRRTERTRHVQDYCCATRQS